MDQIMNRGFGPMEVMGPGVRVYTRILPMPNVFRASNGFCLDLH